MLWYALDGSEVASALGVDAATGLSAERAAALLAAHGPNALPEEKSKPGWLRFIDQYRTYMQMILSARRSCRRPSRSGTPPSCSSCSRSSTRWSVCARRARPRAP